MGELTPGSNPTLDAALSWIKRGAAPISVGYKSKQPIGSAWQMQRHTAESVVEAFNGTPVNIGILWGAPSADLVDVDLDWPEAAKLAALLLPHTAIYGRAGNPGSHHLFRVPDAVTKRWNVPAALVPAGHKDVVLELRAEGTQSVVPPSIHRSGESYAWERECKPAVIAPADLLRRLNLVASGAVLVPLWRNGIRHPLTLALAGTLLTSGYDVDEVRDFIVSVATVAADNELHDRKLAIKSTRAAIEAGTPHTGLPKLAELIGEPAVALLKRWLGLGSALPAGWLAASDAAAALPGTDGGELVVLDAAGIKEEPIRWLWPNRIARGKLNIIAGEPGLSKSVLSCAIGAIVTRGGTWPLDSTRAECGDVLILNVEDDPADTIVPRLRAADADLSRVQIIEGVRAPDGKTRHMTLADVAQLDAHLARAPSRYALLICDPIGALMARRDTHRDADVRALLAPLAMLAMKYGLAVLLIGHLNKGTNMAALHRVIGSIAFVAAARMVHFLTADPDDAKRLLLVPGKTNIAPMGMAGLSYTLESADRGDGIVAPRIRWHDVPEMRTATELLAPPVAKGEQSAVEDWLREELAAGPVPVKAIKASAETSVDASWATIKRAAVRLGVTGSGEHSSRSWALPATSLADTRANEPRSQCTNASVYKCNSSLDQGLESELMVPGAGSQSPLILSEPALAQHTDTCTNELMHQCTDALAHKRNSSSDQVLDAEPMRRSDVAQPGPLIGDPEVERAAWRPCTACERLANGVFCKHYQMAIPEPARPNACKRFAPREALTPWG
jgi:hypothetical protein